MLLGVLDIVITHIGKTNTDGSDTVCTGVSWIEHATWKLDWPSYDTHWIDSSQYYIVR